MGKQFFCLFSLLRTPILTNSVEKVVVKQIKLLGWAHNHLSCSLKQFWWIFQNPISVLRYINMWWTVSKTRNFCQYTTCTSFWWYPQLERWHPALNGFDFFLILALGLWNKFNTILYLCDAGQKCAWHDISFWFPRSTSWNWIPFTNEVFL